MKIIWSISNWIYGEEPLETQFKRLQKFGYDAIELMVTDPDEFDIIQAKKYMDEYGLPCSSICTMVSWVPDKTARRNLIDEDPNIRKRTVDYLKGCLRIGNELDAKLVLFVPSGVANTTDVWTPENKERCVSAMQELGDHAKSLGSILAVIEPINRYENIFLRRCDQALELLEQTNHPQVKMMLDFFHTNIDEDNNGDAIRIAGSNLVHCHIADSNRKSTGRGQTDWFEIFRALRDIDFNGALTCEPLPPTGANVFESLEGTRHEADLYAKECIEYMKYIERVIS
jgi:D-psicose/D-tagatose/L-ribulose 3-epimerase